MVRFKLDDALAFRELGGEIFAITPDDGRFHVIGDETDASDGAVSRLIVEKLRQPASISEIVAAVCGMFDVSPEAAVVDVTRFVEQLEAERIVRRVDDEA